MVVKVGEEAAREFPTKINAIIDESNTNGTLGLESLDALCDNQ